jgi:predicted dithiol-disulfide oxidoreductase (DUF899 family)
MTDFMRDELGAPKIVDRSTFQTELDALRVREKTPTREGDVIAAARRRLPMVEVDGATPLVGERGAVTLLDVFEGRRMLIAYYLCGTSAALRRSSARDAPGVTSQVRGSILSPLCSIQVERCLPRLFRRSNVPRNAL